MFLNFHRIFEFILNSANLKQFLANLLVLPKSNWIPQMKQFLTDFISLAEKWCNVFLCFFKIGKNPRNDTFSLWFCQFRGQLKSYVVFPVSATYCGWKHTWPVIRPDELARKPERASELRKPALFVRSFLPQENLPGMGSKWRHPNPGRCAKTFHSGHGGQPMSLLLVMWRSEHGENMPIAPTNSA